MTSITSPSQHIRSVRNLSQQQQQQKELRVGMSCAITETNTDTNRAADELPSTDHLGTHLTALDDDDDDEDPCKEVSESSHGYGDEDDDNYRYDDAGDDDDDDAEGGGHCCEGDDPYPSSSKTTPTRYHAWYLPSEYGSTYEIPILFEDGMDLVECELYYAAHEQGSGGYDMVSKQYNKNKKQQKQKQKQQQLQRQQFPQHPQPKRNVSPNSVVLQQRHHQQRWLVAATSGKEKLTKEYSLQSCLRPRLTGVVVPPLHSSDGSSGSSSSSSLNAAPAGLPQHSKEQNDSDVPDPPTAGGIATGSTSPASSLRHQHFPAMRRCSYAGVVLTPSASISSGTKIARNQGPHSEKMNCFALAKEEDRDDDVGLVHSRMQSGQTKAVDKAKIPRKNFSPDSFTSTDSSSSSSHHSLTSPPSPPSPTKPSSASSLPTSMDGKDDEDDPRRHPRPNNLRLVQRPRKAKSQSELWAMCEENDVRVSFGPTVRVVTIPPAHEYPDDIGGDLWLSKGELQQSLRRAASEKKQRHRRRRRRRKKQGLQDDEEDNGDDSDEDEDILLGE